MADPPHLRYFSKAAEFYRAKLRELGDQSGKRDIGKLEDRPSYDEGRECSALTLPRNSIDS